MRCSPEMLQALTCSLPRGFGWHLGTSKKVVSTQEDAHEFALKLLDGCSALDDLLCAHVTSCVTCNACGSQNEKLFYDESCVSVELNTSVQAAVESYFDTERVPEDYVFECRRCRNSRATKRVSLMLPPQFLLVHAKRFDSGCNKVRQPMRLSRTLSVRRCIDNFEYLGDLEPEYVLQSVVVHHGLQTAGARGGHYTAYSRDLQNPSSWLSVNDAAVQRARFPFPDAVTDGYLFLYVRKDCSSELMIPRHACEAVFFDVAADVAVLTTECSQRMEHVVVTNAAQDNDALEPRVLEMRRELSALLTCGAQLRLAHRPIFDGDDVELTVAKACLAAAASIRARAREHGGAWKVASALFYGALEARKRRRGGGQSAVPAAKKPALCGRQPLPPCKPSTGDEDADEVADLKDYTDELTRCKNLLVCGSCGEERNVNETRAAEFDSDDAVWLPLDRPPLKIPGQPLKCCDKCFTFLKKGRKPVHAILFRRPVAFELLHQLTPLELRLISPRVIIMTTVTSTSGQRGVRGQTMSFVNSSVDSITRLLPRLIDDAAVVSVRSTQGASGVVRNETVRPELLRCATRPFVLSCCGRF
jgi:hypothetical protein